MSCCGCRWTTARNPSRSCAGWWKSPRGAGDNNVKRAALVLLALCGTVSPLRAQDLRAAVEQRIPAVMPKVIQWRRDIHQHPELSNRETRTAALVAAHLKAL